MNDPLPSTPKEEEEATVPLSSFPFLSLPFELRDHIYSELLIPSRSSTASVAEPCITWHDRHGLQKHSSVYPQILLASKQTNAEATSILYDNATLKISISTPVIKQCTGGEYPDRCGSPQYLLRSDVPYACFNGPGGIYPRCLRKMANIEISLSPEAIWACSMGGSYFSHIGDLLLHVLEVLAEEDGLQQRNIFKRLLFTVHKSIFNDEAITLFPLKSWHGRPKLRSAVREEYVHQIPSLLEAVAARRKLEVVEVATATERVGYGSPQETKVMTRKVDLKSLESL
ncbi:MAG: hypothetical protein Q9168_007726 [Polycauliona sp. 1 TL-2023]